jgi:hypothetical protein
MLWGIILVGKLSSYGNPDVLIPILYEHNPASESVAAKGL